MLDKKYDHKEITGLLIICLWFTGIGATTAIILDTPEQQNNHTKFEKVMNEATLEKLEEANESFNENDTINGIRHVDSAKNTIWANLEITRNESYKLLWKKLSINCIVPEDPRKCQQVIGAADQYINDNLPLDKEEKKGETNKTGSSA